MSRNSKADAILSLELSAGEGGFERTRTTPIYLYFVTLTNDFG